MLPSLESHTRTTVQTLFSFLHAQGTGDYLGEPVTQLQHSLQTATHAENAAADRETIIASLLHDVGRFIPDAASMPAMIAPDGRYLGTGSHDVLGERFLRQLGFSEMICQLVGDHVVAKRYLTAVDPDYYAGLSWNSKNTLKYQGGPFTEEQVKEADKDPWMQKKVALRRWDDLAKDPSMETPPLEHYEEMTVQSLLKSRSAFELDGRTYNLPIQPTAFVCIDDVDREYLEKGAMPNLEKIVHTNSLHIDSAVLEQMSKRGVRIAVVTAKDKQRETLSQGLQNSICFSAENASCNTFEENGGQSVEAWIGRPRPDRSSKDLSSYVLDAGIKLLEEDRADVVYLVLSDSIPREHIIDAKQPYTLLTALDHRISRFLALGAQVLLTGDRDMSSKPDN